MFVTVWLTMSLFTWLVIMRFMYYAVMARSAEEAWQKARVAPAAYNESSRSWRELVDEMRDDCGLGEDDDEFDFSPWDTFSTTIQVAVAAILAIALIAVVTVITWPLQLPLLMLFWTKGYEKRVFKRK